MNISDSLETNYLLTSEDCSRYVLLLYFSQHEIVISVQSLPQPGLKYAVTEKIKRPEEETSRQMTLKCPHFCVTHGFSGGPCPWLGANVFGEQ